MNEQIVNNEELDRIITQLRECRQQLERVRDSLDSSVYDKVRKEINTAISGCNRADRELEDLRPMEGQIDLFELLNEEDEREI